MDDDQHSPRDLPTYLSDSDEDEDEGHGSDSDLKECDWSASQSVGMNLVRFKINSTKL